MALNLSKLHVKMALIAINATKDLCTLNSEIFVVNIQSDRIFLKVLTERGSIPIFMYALNYYGPNKPNMGQRNGYITTTFNLMKYLYKEYKKGNIA